MRWRGSLVSKRYKCVQCGYPVIDDNDLANGVELTNNCATHWRICVSQRYWPSYMRLGKPLDKPLDKTKKKVLNFRAVRNNFIVKTNEDNVQS